MVLLLISVVLSLSEVISVVLDHTQELKTKSQKRLLR